MTMFVDEDMVPWETGSQARILAGGAVGSPQMLLVSGVGPKDVLDSAGISVQIELPGVGQHLQDHLVRSFFFPSCVHL